ncbi:hypothetical protein ACIOJD_19000 [Streptomyces sp. NPDC088116]|uniref:hypothetical protein n=1 Tax=Streptomyces sp. NPDC088116 TaxID=3365825 RepID=UPI00380AB70D
MSTLAVLVGIPLAFAADSSTRIADDEAPPTAVEDYSYPGATSIEATRGIKLKKGDGRILLVDCDRSASQIRVLTVKDPAANRDEIYCFQATARTGYVTLELPRVFGLETTDHPISADLTAGGRTETVVVPKDDFKSVGEGTPGGAQSVLVEIRVTG